MVDGQAGRWPGHGWAGLVLVGAFWALNWSLPGLRTHWGFFPLWLGYILTVDALVLRRTGDSMLRRDPTGFAALFVVSAPGWWLFELLNLRTENWTYRGAESFGPLAYFGLCTVSFSTVMPAVFETAELVGTARAIRRLGRGPRVGPSRKAAAAMFAAGWLMLGALLAWPRYCYPFLWGSVYLILEPINARLGYRTLLERTKDGDWRGVASLSLGCLICGFFWELWNVYSYPKWVYDVPFVGFLHVFEMPLLGYLGYPVFAWELHALYHLIAGLAGRPDGFAATAGAAAIDGSQAGGVSPQ